MLVRLSRRNQVICHLITLAVVLHPSNHNLNHDVRFTDS
jgi:hypothetical protein